MKAGRRELELLQGRLPDAVIEVRVANRAASWCREHERVGTRRSPLLQVRLEGLRERSGERDLALRVCLCRPTWIVPDTSAMLSVTYSRRRRRSTDRRRRAMPSPNRKP